MNETVLVKLTANNCKVKSISHRNNLLVDVIEGDFRNSMIIMHKKYFNQIAAHGSVEGRIRHTDDGLLIFEGFSFR
jgi:hypothetical protein